MTRPGDGVGPEVTALTRWKLTACALLAAVAAPAAVAATCPFNVAVLALPPHAVNGYAWGAATQPMGDACVSHIAVEPTNSNAWYVGGQNGLYMTKNAGAAWTHPIPAGKVGALLLVPGSPQLVYVGVGKRLYLSRDKGAHWTVIKTYNFPVSSLLVAGGTLYVGLAWSTHAVPSGVFVSNLGGGGSQFKSFGAGFHGLIVWTLARDALTGTLYAGTEIFDHPQPYDPPFLRSINNGNAWTNTSGTLPWHVIATAMRPGASYAYALTEGAGLFGSSNQSLTWQPLANSPTTPTVSLLQDPSQALRLFGGRVKSGTITGGAFVSKDGGQTFQAIGLKGVTVGGLALSANSGQLYAAAYASGVYVATVP